MEKENLIKKWLRNDLTDEEKTSFEAMDDYSFHQKIIDGAQHFKASEVTDISSYNEFKNRSSSNIRKPKQYTQFLKIAALIAVIVAIGSLFMVNSNNTTTTLTLVSEKNTIALPDASEVIINASSQITYNKDGWTADKREVTLDGEAFFKVTKGSSFEVNTSEGKISVLGTKFNVKQREGYFEVQCFEGIVQVDYANHTQKLYVGEVIKVINGRISQGKITGAQPSWIDNISQFKSVPYRQVIEEFERQYDVSVTLKNVNGDRFFTGGFVHNSLNEGLKSITLPLDLSYKLSEDKKDIIIKKLDE